MKKRRPGVVLEDADHHQELADEAAGARQADRGHGEDHEHDGIFRHAVNEAAVARDLAGVQAVIDDADAQEERTGDDAVGEHLEQRAFEALLGHREDTGGDEAHMGHRRIGDELLHVLLRQRNPARCR